MVEMGSNSFGGGNDHAIKIWEVKKDRLASMQQQILEAPKILSKAAGRSSCCIFRIPQRLVEINGMSYQPHIVSIGPYHRGKPQHKMIEEHKWQYLGSLLSRTQSKGLGLEDYLKAIQPLEMKARECYSETVHLDTDEFIEMMVLDGCFIIELFRKVGNLVPIEFDDPLFSMAWTVSFFHRDLIRLENQLPFFVLECLFNLSKLPGEETGPSLVMLALEFFDYALQRPEGVIKKYHNLEGKHLLDLLRSSIIPLIPQEPHTYDKSNSPSHIIHCVSKLRRAGIKLQSVKADTFLTVKFRHGVIEMPTITVDEFTSTFLLNCVAFEQCHSHCSNHITTYATLLDCLINTSKDVEYLCDRNIIENYFGTDGDVAHFINGLGKEVAFDINRCYLSKLFNDVHHYYRNSWHVQWASFKYTYFDTPWSFISAFAALILLLLTLAQTFFTVYPYYRPGR
ncbi:hypothetical protein L1049_008243 [Liquidambar formosana]|uniref:Uncharacterized protein n=1 Tax=Liquidambar formosana TaxID=63359 RepID=A0AAP0X273_LIQFO